MSPAEEHFVEGMCSIADFWGMPRAMGAVYGYIYLSPDSVTLDELVERTGFSKGSISTNVRALERFQMVRKTVKVGDRKDYYAAETDLWRVARNVLEQRRKAEFGAALATVKESLEMLEPGPHSPEDRLKVGFQRQRIEHMESFFGMLDRVVGGLLLMDKLGTASLGRLTGKRT